MKNSIATREANPGKPAIPDISAVNRLIGMCISKEFPIAFNKKRSNAPIQKRVIPNPSHLIGRMGAPASKRTKMIVPSIAITVIGSTLKTSYTYNQFYLLVIVWELSKKKTSSYFNLLVVTFLFLASFNKKKYLDSAN